VNREIVNREIVNREIVNNEIVYREIVNREIVNREIANREIANREIANREIANREIVNREIVNPYPYTVESNHYLYFGKSCARVVIAAACTCLAVKIVKIVYFPTRAACTGVMDGAAPMYETSPTRRTSHL
jgi:hypothetical protein